MTLEEHSNGAGRQPVEASASSDAALVLVESLIHVLIERSVLTVPDAMSAVQTAIDVVTEVPGEMGAVNATTIRSADRLFSILDSLAVDAHEASPDGPNPPYPPLHSVD